MTIFDNLEQYYPTKPKTELYADLGGQWPELVDHPNYQNTCAIRLSVAFHAAGYSIPKKYKEAIAGDGRNIIIKVRTMWDYVTEQFGQFTWGMSKEPGTVIQIPPKKGMLVYHKAFSDATGHFDLWKGTSFVGSGNLDDVKDGFSIAMWWWE
ncbi:T6SS effector amidase Tae4 family protein [Mesorhizobium sp. M0522]|uniref:T6SS effector amidase Tae4 family protein n=1 Tax=unclassified Mesorhizobium TaxID=325217 RepID=UPI003334C85C